MGRTAHSHSVRVLIAAAAIVAMASSAWAMSVLDPPGATTTLSDTTSGEVATYEFGTYSTAGTNRQLHQFVYTFPSGTDLSGATLTSHPGTVSYTGTTLTVTFDPRIVHETESFTIVISGVVNGAAGTYTGQTAQFHTTNPGGRQEQTDTLAVGDYTIYAAPYLSLTITTPHPGQSVDFGDLEPGVTAGPLNVGLTVDSSRPFVVTRDIAGDADALGLEVSGVPIETQGPGEVNLTDSYLATPPWTTEPELEYAALITYSVVQQ